MTRGDYRRLSGILRLSGRSPVLETVEHGLIRLQSTEDLTSYDGARVIAEGHLSTPDRLTLTWVGHAPD